jgi:hypothetical protein
MGWFSRKPVTTGTFRVTGATRLDGIGQMVLGGVPQVKVHVSGIVEAEGMAPQAFALEQHFDMNASPVVGAVLPADITSRDPLKVRVHWTTPALDQHVTALRNDSDAQVIQQLMTTGRATHTAGDTDPLGLALSDPAASDTIANQLASALGTPITVDVDEGGVKRHLTVGGGGHLSSAEAAALERTGTAATATVRGATRVPIPQAMLPGPDASLWDLDLTVVRADGTSYDAQTRVGFRSEARRLVLGLPGLRIPVRIDPADDTRVALDSTTYDSAHPDAPPR